MSCACPPAAEHRFGTPPVAAYFSLTALEGDALGHLEVDDNTPRHALAGLGEEVRQVVIDGDLAAVVVAQLAAVLEAGGLSWSGHQDAVVEPFPSLELCRQRFFADHHNRYAGGVVQVADNLDVVFLHQVKRAGFPSWSFTSPARTQSWRAA